MYRVVRWFKQLFCVHEVRIADIRRVSPEEVIGVCRKCHKLLSAPYGLAIPAKLVR